MKYNPDKRSFSGISIVREKAELEYISGSERRNETKLQINLSRNFARKGSREIGQQLERRRTSKAVF